MPIKHIITPGIGFSPGSPMYIVTRGFSIGVVTVPPVVVINVTARVNTTANVTARVNTTERVDCPVGTTENLTMRIT